MGRKATVGYGSRLAYGAADGTGPLTQVAYTRDLNGPEPEVGDIDITNNSSPDNTK